MCNGCGINRQASKGLWSWTSQTCAPTPWALLLFSRSTCLPLMHPLHPACRTMETEGDRRLKNVLSTLDMVWRYCACLFRALKFSRLLPSMFSETFPIIGTLFGFSFLPSLWVTLAHLCCVFSLCTVSHAHLRTYVYFPTAS